MKREKVEISANILKALFQNVFLSMEPPMLENPQ